MFEDMPRRLAGTATLQAGIVSRQQALAARMTHEQVRFRVRSGRWRQLYRGVYATFTGKLTDRARLWAVVLAVGEGAVLSHETAATYYGLDFKPQPYVLPIHVSVPRNRHVAPIPGVRIHRTSGSLVIPGADYPSVTAVADTVLDLTNIADDIDDVCGWVTRAFQRDKMSDLEIRYALARRGRLRWRAEIAEFIDVAVGGDESVLEVRYTMDVERKHGLPQSTRQVAFTGPDGRKGRRDRVYEDFGVIIELDGWATHKDRVRQDRMRDNAATEEGKRALRYDWLDVRHHYCKTAVQASRILQRNGWDGQPRACSPGCAVSRA